MKSTPDALAAIDATMDGLCACGCGHVLDVDGPSGWYATESCQRRFMNGQADNPAEVYNSGDAGAEGALQSLLDALLRTAVTGVRRGGLQWTTEERDVTAYGWLRGDRDLTGRVLFVGGSRHGQLVWDRTPPSEYLQVYVPPREPVRWFTDGGLSFQFDRGETETYWRTRGHADGQDLCLYVHGDASDEQLRDAWRRRRYTSDRL